MIEATELTKKYGHATAVDGLSFTVRPGHVTGFLGPNGAGKSTTMRMILGLDSPSRGTVTVNGRPYGHLKRPLHQIGAVLEVRAVHSGRSAYNHLLCLAQASGIGKQRVTEVLDLVGLDGVGRKRAGKFSLGMSQRLGLAAALLGDPPVLVCDEPVNGLDPEGILWIRTLLRSLAAEGRAVFVSSHLMSEMALTADRLIVIGQGKLLADASTADVIASGSTGYIQVRTRDPHQLAGLLRAAGATVTDAPNSADGEPLTDNEAGGLRVTGLDPDAIGDLAAEHRISILELTPHHASLEAAYMELTRDHADFHTTTASAGPNLAAVSTGSGA
ncbi:MAG: ATP-binding cassette domain-containing protein [Pseudonocardiales bacterium]